MKKLTLLCALSLACAGCKVHQSYTKPVAPLPQNLHPTEAIPTATSEAEDHASGWKRATPSDAALKSQWWELFGDSQLNSLEERIEVNNQTLKVAASRYTEARTLVQTSRANRMPSLAAGGDVERVRDSMNRGVPPPASESDFNDFSIGLSAAWEPDLWGRIGYLIGASVAEAQASAADLENVRLSLQAEVAADYFSVRSLSNEQHVLHETVEAYARALKMVQDRYDGGMASRIDVEQARTQYESATVQERNLDESRAKLVHALAVLVGETPENFKLNTTAEVLNPPTVPVGLPSELLERRPDVAAVERRVASANSQIGLARTAYYPQVILSGSLGMESKNLRTWAFAPSRYWAVGPQISESIFDGGRRRAALAQSQAAYDGTVAGYRQSVLEALEQVEDSLSSLDTLADEAAQQKRAVASARKAEEISLHRYEGGLVTYLEVISTQSTRLQNERTAVDIERRRMQASVALIRALGGGWSTSALPTPSTLAGKK